MRREYRIDSIEISEGTVFANCYDILYDEPFKKYLGKPESENAILNAQDLLQDGIFSISEDVRKEIEEIFSIKALPGVEESYEENIEKKDTLLEKINEIDRSNNNAYDLKNLYCSCELSDYEKSIVECFLDHPKNLYKYLSCRLEEEFLLEKRPSVTSVVQKDHKGGHTDNRYTSKTSSNVTEVDKINFKRFPGGKVKIDGRYYPGDLIELVVKNKKGGRKKLYYPAYANYVKSGKDDFTILAHSINPKILKDEIYIKMFDEKENGYVGIKLTYGEFLQIPEDEPIEEITEEEYNGLTHEISDSSFIIFDGKEYKKSEIKLYATLIKGYVDDSLKNVVTFDKLEDAFQNHDEDFIYKFLGNSGQLIDVEPEELKDEVTNWFKDNIKKFNEDNKKKRKQKKRS